MQDSLVGILELLRARSQNEVEKGQYFERLVKVYLENDTLHTQQYDKVWHFRDWAKEQGMQVNDI